jgi:hypothetical protein
LVLILAESGSLTIGVMPTVLRVGRFRFFFYSNEGREPAHVHVVGGEDEAKFWLEPLLLATSYGFTSSELRRIELILDEHRNEIMEAWRDYFAT